MTRRGRLSCATISSMEWAPMTLVPLASLARNSSTFATVRLKATTVKPWSFMLRIRFWPMTARPISAMSPFGSMCSVHFRKVEGHDTRAPQPRQQNLCLARRVAPNTVALTGIEIRITEDMKSTLLWERLPHSVGAPSNAHWFNAGLAVFFLAVLWTSPAIADLNVHPVEVAMPAPRSLVPAATDQGHFLAPQAISAVDISADGNFITVGTMAFSHDANVWQLTPDGTVFAKRHFPPWAPMQVATLRKGRAAAVGLAYSRVTSPDPTVWLGRLRRLFAATLDEQLAEADSSDGELARLRPGGGDWRTGWFASSLGELFVRGPDWIFKPPRSWLDADGHRSELRFEKKNLLPTSRAMRMAASADGRRLAFAWLGFPRERSRRNVAPLRWRSGK